MDTEIIAALVAASIAAVVSIITFISQILLHRKMNRISGDEIFRTHRRTKAFETEYQTLEEFSAEMERFSSLILTRMMEPDGDQVDRNEILKLLAQVQRHVKDDVMVKLAEKAYSASNECFLIIAGNAKGGFDAVINDPSFSKNWTASLKKMEELRKGVREYLHRLVQ